MEQLTLEALLVTEPAPPPPAPAPTTEPPSPEPDLPRRAVNEDLQAVLDVLDSIPPGGERQYGDLTISRCEERWETCPRDPTYSYTVDPYGSAAGGRLFIAKCIQERGNPRVGVAV